jgi:hypothetical protein
LIPFKTTLNNGLFPNFSNTFMSLQENKEDSEELREARKLTEEPKHKNYLSPKRYLSSPMQISYSHYDTRQN